jgi:hypothetical protein
MLKMGLGDLVNQQTCSKKSLMAVSTSLAHLIRSMLTLRPWSLLIGGGNH